MTHDADKPAQQDDAFVAGIRRQLDRSCDALDGQTLSRLTRIRHVALARRQAPTTRLLLPFGGFATACLLVVAVTTFSPRDNIDDVVAPLEDLDILTASESLDLYEDYDFYRWLAENEVR